MVTDWVFEEFQAHKMYNEIPKKKFQIENQNSIWIQNYDFIRIMTDGE